MNYIESLVLYLNDHFDLRVGDDLIYSDIPHTHTGSNEFHDEKASRGRGQQNRVQTHTFTDFPRPVESDDEDKQDVSVM